MHFQYNSTFFVTFFFCNRILGNHETTLDAYFYNNRKTLYPNSYIHSKKLDTTKAMQIMTSNPDIDFLLDSGTTYRNQKIWGTPWVPQCGVWGFMYRTKEEAIDRFSLIPEDTDILLSHCPPHGVLDLASKKKYVFNEDTCETELKKVPEHFGCPFLAERVVKVKPKAHFFGHIHESSGWTQNEESGMLSVNSCICDPLYSPDNKPKIVNYYYEV